VAQVDPDPSKPNLGVEPLPDIDFNIRAGNTLVGYTTIDEIRRSHQARYPGFPLTEVQKLEVQAQSMAKLYSLFCRLQTNGSKGETTPEELANAKNSLRREQQRLADELNRYLAGDYGVDAHNVKKAKDFEKWRGSHQPFHWFIEFYGIMQSGGFDAVIGNPPYLDLRDLTTYTPRGFSTIATRNLYPIVLEKCQSITAENGRQGYIVPVSSVATEGYLSFQRVLTQRNLFASSYDDRPSHLFDGLDKNTLSILLLGKKPIGPRDPVYSTRLARWNAEERETLFALVRYSIANEQRLPGCLPKIGNPIEASIWRKLFERSRPLSVSYSAAEENVVYYSRKVNAFMQVLDFVPQVRDGKGKLRPPSEFKTLLFDSKAEAAAVCCLFNSTLFRWFMDVVSDGSHLNRREVDNFPFDPKATRTECPQLVPLAKRLSRQFQETSEQRVMRYKHDTLTVQCIIPRHAKSIIDEIDQSLGNYYGFTDDETDFIINYDIKYRIGQDGEDDGEE